MASRTPAVSVVMPVYDEAAFVEAAAESILRQTLTDLELVIVDNGSTDHTAARQITTRRVRAAFSTCAEKRSRVPTRPIRRPRGED